MIFPRVCSMEHDTCACEDAQVGGSNSIHLIVISVTFYAFVHASNSTCVTIHLPFFFGHISIAYSGCRQTRWSCGISIAH